MIEEKSTYKCKIRVGFDFDIELSTNEMIEVDEYLQYLRNELIGQPRLLLPALALYALRKQFGIDHPRADPILAGFTIEDILTVLGEVSDPDTAHALLSSSTILYKYEKSIFETDALLITQSGKHVTDLQSGETYPLSKPEQSFLLYTDDHFSVGQIDGKIFVQATLMISGSKEGKTQLDARNRLEHMIRMTSRVGDPSYFKLMIYASQEEFQQFSQDALTMLRSWKPQMEIKMSHEDLVI